MALALRGSQEAPVRRFAIVPLLFVGLGIVPHAQEPVVPRPAAQSSTPKVFRTSASVVALNVTVTDGRKLVTGLARNDFEVYEDGVQQEVRFFESSEVPLDVILLLDASSSMRARMPLVHEAAKSFMRILRPGDRGAIVAFNEHVRVVQDLTSDASAIETAISSTVAQGATALHNAIYIALEQFGRKARTDAGVRRQAIAVLSDGEDTSSLVSFDDVVTAARKTGVNIYTISLLSEIEALRQKSPNHFSQAGYSMKMLAKETGAQSFFPANVHELKNVYGAIASELEAQYSIAYAPTNNRPDGRFRRIIVRVPSDPSLKPRARSGYTAETIRASLEGLR
jgi:Ca-activated chloride channel family protein